MPKPRPNIDHLIGQKFNFLTVLKILEWKTKLDWILLCKCDCGKDYKIYKNALLSGSTKSCGCWRKHSNWENNYKINETTGCWKWLGGKNSSGYGAANLRIGNDKRKRSFQTHRMFYEKFKGKIEKGLLVCHHCDNPICVNPEHLFLGTHQDNCNDKMKKGRHVAKGKKE